MDMGMLTDWTNTTWGQVVVGVSILGLGAAHFGKGSDLMSKSVMGISVGTVAGAVGVLIGLTTLLGMKGE
jgi:hypothetical protein